MQKINIMISAKTWWMKSVTKMRWYRKNWLKMSLNDLKYDLKYCVGRMLKLQRKHLLCTQQRQGIQAGHILLEEHDCEIWTKTVHEETLSKKRK